MAANQFEHADQARLALRTVVAEHGPKVLSDPRTLANLLSDLLPESPRITKIMVAAAQDKIADELKQHTSDGMDGQTASRLAASSFAGATMFTPDACAWVVAEFSLALGLTADPDQGSPFAASMTAQVVPGHDRTTTPADTEPASHRQLPEGQAEAQVAGQVREQAAATELDVGISTEPWSVCDLGSANGTQVNGREISVMPVPLGDGDRISLGAWTVLTIHSS
jgi:hypothetical protein